MLGEALLPRLSIAPMMDYTDRHFRRILRPLTRHTLFYTEMINANAVVRGGRVDQLAFDAEEHPVALQLGGDDPAVLSEAARIAEDLGYREVNLNIGCPSDRVRKGRFGACLMAEPGHVGEMVATIAARVRIPVTVKHRIGIDDLDSYDHMRGFVDTVAAAGCQVFIVHARKAWLKGLSPKQNRTVPPLRHDEVHRLKRERPDLLIATNGGVRTLDEAKGHLAHVDSVMIGRAACDTPWIFARADTAIFGAASDPASDRAAFLDAALPILAAHVEAGGRFHQMGRHLLGLFHTERQSRRWKQGIAALGQMQGPEAIPAFARLVAEMTTVDAHDDAPSPP
jgi:tRNA-dihydrouridine synthase A